jgi:hypothetical protein
MILPQNQVAFRKKVGKVGTKSIWHIKLKGGLHVMADDAGKVIGSGPHRAVARHLASKYEPDAVWSELSKSDHVDLEAFEHLLPKYEALTKSMMAMQAAASEPTE